MIVVVLVVTCLCIVGLVLGSLSRLRVSVRKHSTALLIRSGIWLVVLIVVTVVSVLTWKLVVEQALLGLWTLISVRGKCVSALVLGPVVLTLRLWQIRVELMSMRLNGRCLVSLSVSVAPLEVAGFTRNIVGG